MPNELISKKTRQEFREYFVGQTLRQIEMAFDAADITCDIEYNPNISGARRSSVEQYYHSLDFTKWSDVKKILKVYENELIHLEEIIKSGSPWVDSSKNAFESLKRWLLKDGYTYSVGKLSRNATELNLSDVTQVAISLDAPELQRQIDRLRSAAQDDPALAVGTAKELLETICKTILGERGETVNPEWDLPRLLKQTRESLGLMPEQIPEEVKGLDIIKKLLGNLGALAHSLAELRNLYGTGHGKHGQAKGLEPRHARLAVGSAATLATFLFETHQLRKNK